MPFAVAARSHSNVRDASGRKFIQLFRGANPLEQLQQYATVMSTISADSPTEVKDVMPDFIKFNIGGTPFQLSSVNVVRRGEVGFMYKFFSVTHERRLELCDNYNETTEEYYFERPTVLFDPIYTYYTTGHIYKPGRKSMNSFFGELTFWGLTKVFFPELRDQNENPPENNFAKVRFGAIRATVWNLLEVPESSGWAKIVGIISTAFVLLSNLGMVLASMSGFRTFKNVTVDIGENETKRIQMEQPHPVIENLELGCMAFFTFEYLIKMLVAHNRFKTFFQISSLIDLLAILPFYMEHVLLLCGLDFTQLHDVQAILLVTKILRISRVIRLFKLGKHSSGMQLCAKVMERSATQFCMVAVAGMVVLVFCSTLVYFVEKDQANTKFESIPATCWWAMVTMSTVGYGDMVPDTPIGKLLGSFTIAVGVLVCALPITVMVDNFIHIQQEFEEMRQNMQKIEQYRKENNARRFSLGQMKEGQTRH